MTIFNQSILAELILKEYTHVFCLPIHDDKVILIQPLKKPGTVEAMLTTVGYMYDISHPTVYEMAVGVDNAQFLLAEDLLFKGKRPK
jgi:hypothetical protein